MGCHMKPYLPLAFLVFSCVCLIAKDEGPSPSVFQAGEGVNGQVLAIVVQADGKIIIGGSFSAVNGFSRGNLARLNADGTLDRTFADQYEAGVNGTVFAMVAHPAGGVVVGGAFSTAGNAVRRTLAHFNNDGSVDLKFGSGESGEVTNGCVNAIAILSDGKFVLGGSFNAVFGKQRLNLARLNADGTLDDPISPKSIINGQINSLAPLSRSKILAGGGFSVDGKEAQNLFRAGN